MNTRDVIPPEHCPSSAAATCLVVEDVAETRAFLCEMVAQVFRGAAVEPLGSLAEAEAWISERARAPSLPAPSIALVDLGLPDGSGLAVIRRLAATFPSTPVIVVTIYDDDQHLFDAILAGAQGYLLKDADQAAMTERLLRMRDGEPALSPAIARRILAHLREQRAPGSAESARAASGLTTREAEVLGLIGKGFTVRATARHFGISENTVASHLKSVYAKLGIASRAEAATKAARFGLL